MSADDIGIAESPPARCRVCFGPLLAPTAIRDEMFESGQEATYRLCADCGCLQQDEAPSAIQTLYPEEYYAHEEQAEGFSARARVKHRAARTYLSLHRPLARIPIGGLLPRYIRWTRIAGVDQEGAIADIGAGAGKLVRDMTQSGFGNVRGFDPYISRDIQYRNGASVSRKHLAEVEDSFDFIMFNHSLEHMPDQRGALMAARGKLGPGGSIMIRIPLYDSWASRVFGRSWVQLDSPRHIYLHSVRSVFRLAANSGLEVYHVAFDSTSFQFWGSNVVRRGLPGGWASAQARNGSGDDTSLLTRIVQRLAATGLNHLALGDQAAFYLRPTES